MWSDPIVKEVRDVREKIAKECNFDIHSISQMLQEYQPVCRPKSKAALSMKP